MRNLTRGLAIGLILILASGCGSPEGRLKKAQALAATGKQPQAAQAFESAVSKDRDWPRVGEDYLGLAKCRLALGEKDKAAAAAAKALALLCDQADRSAAAGGYAAEAQMLRELLSAFADVNLDAGLTARAAVLAGLTSSGRKDTLDKVDATKLTVANVATASRFDVNEFPYITQVTNNKIPSPDGTRLLWREKEGLTYYLKVSGADGRNTQVLKACKNGFRPSWSPDGGKILYTAINWGRIERAICVYDLATGKASPAFRSRKGLGALAAWSPEGSKIIFTYRSQLWVMNANGIGLALLNINQTAREAQLLAWSKDGTKLAYLPMGETGPLIVSLAMKP